MAMLFRKKPEAQKETRSQAFAEYAHGVIGTLRKEGLVSKAEVDNLEKRANDLEGEIRDSGEGWRADGRARREFAAKFLGVVGQSVRDKLKEAQKLKEG